MMIRNTVECSQYCGPNSTKQQLLITGQLVDLPVISLRRVCLWLLVSDGGCATELALPFNQTAKQYLLITILIGTVNVA